MLDISDLTLPGSNLPEYQHHWMCEQCRMIVVTRTVCSCGNSHFVPYFDRRPLLLTKEVRNRIVDLIDEAADMVPNLSKIEEQLYLTDQYMPFLSSLLTDAETAEKRRDEFGGGFRQTDVSVVEMISLFKKMQLPPTPGSK